MLLFLNKAVEGHFVVVELSLFYITKVCVEVVISTSERYKNCKIYLSRPKHKVFSQLSDKWSTVMSLVTKVFDRISETCGLARHLIIHGIKMVPVQHVRIKKQPDY